ncbi:type II secretion system F family protein [Candidatus Micrarchaeota archaeon]|nr:type II secretion system F family protein [Candidatus Micrarchaeota archaeon]
MAKKDINKSVQNAKQKTSNQRLLRPFRRIGSIVPKNIVDHFETKLKYAGIRHDPKIWVGVRILFSFFIGMFMIMIYLALTNPEPTPENIGIVLLIWLFGFGISMIVSYLNLFFMMSDRSTELEKILPDFLLLIVSNLRAGMSPFNAFTHAAKPEFGPLYEEVMLSAAKAGGKSSLADALNNIGDYFDSQIFRRTIMLFTKGMRSGGQLAALLNSSAEEVQHIQDLRAELGSATRTYALFLGFIIIVIMPFLLSIATLFVTIFLAMQPEDSGQQAVAGVPMFSGKISITPDEMMLTSVCTLALTSLIMSALAGILQKGKLLYGLKYFPVYAIAAIIFYFLAHYMLGSMLMNFG